MTHPVGAVVFDLAGVLLEFRGAESIARLSGGKVTAAQFSQFWNSPLADDLYTDRCSADEFARGAVKAFGLSVSPEVFLHEFRQWLRGPYDGALELVAQVRTRALVACLSNTNSLDVERFRNEYELERRFDRCFFSNEIRLRKPAPASYSHVLHCLGFDQTPERVVFFDDSIDCVEGARVSGMQAYQVTTVPTLRRCLESLGLVSPSVAHTREH